MATLGQPLVCPRCGSTRPPSERFCPDCRMPLVHTGSVGAEHEASERQQRARKVKPQYAEGGLVRVAWARNQVEAEFIQGLLLEEGVPSLLRRARGFDVPDFLAAGPRDVLVPESGFAVAREILLQAEIVSDEEKMSSVTRPTRLLAGLLLALVVVAVVLFAGTHVIN
jgi:predicted nucleic acid-binding Zn ribbon protein